MRTYYTIYSIEWKTILVPNHDYYRHIDFGDDDIYELKFIKQFDTEIDAIDFIDDECKKDATYTILKTYNK